MTFPWNHPHPWNTAQTETRLPGTPNPPPPKCVRGAAHCCPTTTCKIRSDKLLTSPSSTRQRWFTRWQSLYSWHRMALHGAKETMKMEDAGFAKGTSLTIFGGVGFEWFANPLVGGRSLREADRATNGPRIQIHARNMADGFYRWKKKKLYQFQTLPPNMVALLLNRATIWVCGLIAHL